MMPTIEVDSIFGRIEAFKDDLITNQIISFGAHTRPELALLAHVVEPGDRIFDIGGHIGTFGIPLALKTGPLGRVLIVEGSEDSFRVLSRNVRRTCDGLNVDLVHALVLPEGKKGTLVSDAENTGASYVVVGGDASSFLTCLSLDRLLAQFFEPRIVKIDIEGFEYAALSEANNLLAARPIVYAEVCDALLQRAGASAECLDRLFHENGYRCFRNVAARNAAHDSFDVKEISGFENEDSLFDVLAIHRGDSRLDRLSL